MCLYIYRPQLHHILLRKFVGYSITRFAFASSIHLGLIFLSRRDRKRVTASCKGKRKDRDQGAPFRV